jgi:hypothetical protein
MSQKTFTIIASVIFGVVALFHVLRIFLGWPAVIGGSTVINVRVSCPPSSSKAGMKADFFQRPLCVQFGSCDSFRFWMDACSRIG